MCTSSNWRRFARAVRAVVVLALLGGAGSGEAAAQSLQFRHLGPDEGLSSSWVTDIVQDRHGYFWFGTGNGLTRYDGYEFTVYRHQRNQPHHLADNHVNVLYEDRSGGLWVGTRAGLSLYDRDLDRFSSFAWLDQVASPSAQHVTSIAEDSRGRLWVGTSQGAFHFDRTTGRVRPVPLSGVETLSVVEIIAGADGRIWIGTQTAGLYEIETSSGVERQHAHDPEDLSTIPDNEIGALIEDAAGAVWIGTSKGEVARLDPATGSVTRFRYDTGDPNSVARTRIMNLELDRNRGLWIATENGGLDHFDPATGRVQHNVAEGSNPRGLNSNSVWTLYQDAGGTLWAGTFSGGVNVTRQNGNAIRHYRSLPADATSLSYNSVLGFAEDVSGTIWVATDGGGLNRFRPGIGRFDSFTTRNSNLNSDAVLAVATDREGSLWLGTWGGGLSRFDPRTGRFTAFTPQNSNIPDINIFSVYEDRAGRLWVGSWNKGLLLFDRERQHFTVYPISPPGQSESQIWLIHELHDGRLALATLEDGLSIFDPATGSIERYISDPRDESTLASNRVQALIEIEPGLLWIGTSDGLDRLDLRTGRLEHVNAANALPSTMIAGLASDTGGNLWISTNRGISRLDPRSGSVKSYTTADGLQGSEYNPRAYLRSRDGSLLFAGNSGFNIIHPERIEENTRPPTVVLTGLQLFNQPVRIGHEGSPLERHISQTDRLILSHRESVFTFEFAALDYLAPEKNHYAYKLEGFDSDWNHVGPQRSASYTGLPPGEYVFRVKASNNDGYWNEEGTSIRVSITPPFWKTWWFRLLVILVIYGTVHGLIARARHRREVLRRQKEYLETSVSEILSGMEKLSDGDLTVQLRVQNDDEIGRLCGGFNNVVGDIRNMVQQVNEALLVTVAATQQIHASTEEMAAGSQEQMQQAHEVSVAAEQMSLSVAETARHMSGAAEMARRSGEEAKHGGIIASETIAGMNDIALVVERSARAVEALGDSSRKITHITRVIDDIADQTNLLALNATIEAAHAGEHGRGFAVVADEVRTLAMRTAQATNEISRMIEQIQSETRQAVETMGQVTGQVETGKLLVDRAGSALTEIIANSARVLDGIRQVAAASEEQAVSTTQISRNIEGVSEVNRSAAVGQEAIARAAQNLTQLVEDLHTRVARFHLQQSNAVPPALNPPATHIEDRVLTGV